MTIPIRERIIHSFNECIKHLDDKWCKKLQFSPLIQYTLYLHGDLHGDQKNAYKLADFQIIFSSKNGPGRLHFYQRF